MYFLIFINKDEDNTFYSFTFVCFVLFFLEFLIFSIFKADYLFSFPFWMDLLSALTLILDIPWLSLAILGVDGNGYDLLK